MIAMRLGFLQPLHNPSNFPNFFSLSNFPTKTKPSRTDWVLDWILDWVLCQILGLKSGLKSDCQIT
ncbi:hypothetical protein B0181_00515 [Moraxella caviae]|uniref:Uncharacterized protein n=1 Tax=Moraxella caviae TaxID=34060 RepID=A0A1T0ACX2_9GAMM|nr:hypothetical protein B0181_00515 [Moraxella caviae]